MKAGEEKIIEKTFPEDSDSPYAGKTVKLKVKITTIKERQLPDLDDELAQDVGEEYKTLDDLRKKIRKDLKKNAEIRIRNKKINDISDKLVETSEITVPESMINNELERSWKDYVNQSGVQEDLLIKVLEQAGKSKNDILNEWREGAEKSIKRQLIYGKIIEDEKIEASTEEIEEKMKQNAEEFGMSVEDVEKMFGGEQYKEYLKGEIVQDKLYDLLIENAVIKKGDKIDYNDLINA
jgi:trigger factor